METGAGIGGDDDQQNSTGESANELPANVQAQFERAYDELPEPTSVKKYFSRYFKPAVKNLIEEFNPELHEWMSIDVAQEYDFMQMIYKLYRAAGGRKDSFNNVLAAVLSCKVSL